MIAVDNTIDDFLNLAEKINKTAYLFIIII